MFFFDTSNLRWVSSLHRARKETQQKSLFLYIYIYIFFELIFSMSLLSTKKRYGEKSKTFFKEIKLFFVVVVLFLCIYFFYYSYSYNFFLSINWQGGYLWTSTVCPKVESTSSSDQTFWRQNLQMEKIDSDGKKWEKIIYTRRIISFLAGHKFYGKNKNFDKFVELFVSMDVFRDI